MPICSSENETGRPSAAKELEAELTRRFIQGEICVFEMIVQHHQKRIARLVWRLTGWNGSEVDDLVQDVFLAVYVNQKQFNGRCSVGSWLTTIAINRCRSWQRRQKLKAAFFLKASCRESEPSDSYLAVARAETAWQVQRAIGVLPGPLREVTVLRYLEQMEIDQIAALLKIKPNAVEVRLTRARQRLRESMSNFNVNKD